MAKIVTKALATEEILNPLSEWRTEIGRLVYYFAVEPNKGIAFLVKIGRQTSSYRKRTLIFNRIKLRDKDLIREFVKKIPEYVKERLNQYFETVVDIS